MFKQKLYQINCNKSECLFLIVSLVFSSWFSEFIACVLWSGPVLDCNITLCA